ncbi:uncharacterized protein LOC131438129 [Malaya genurostris]|uniref:uncharacterized protein LOC131438129 n=1 Tax=Malaya genurostris TaxID=325434 RepID=UPI0026F3E496|nr:uncharacterized protein LOC131438129 [Malaya genurostris]
MDVFTSLIENKTSAQKTLKVRKIYINEDPNVEKSETCPKCLSQNRQSSVRYMFINMKEAIFKCEAVNCMFPFRNFKYKNYIEQSVYYYQSDADEKLPDLTSFDSPVNSTSDKSAQLCKAFDMHFISPDRNHSSTSSPAKNLDSSDLNIFDSPSLSYSKLAEGFDTGFIDDILSDLGESSASEKTPILVNPLRPSAEEQVTSKSNRQLKRCLQMFQENRISDCKTDGIFKIPALPNPDGPVSPLKLKFKKSSPHKRNSFVRRSNLSKLTSEKILKKNHMKPLQFLESLNNIRQPEDTRKISKESSLMPGIQSLGNQKVARMLDFIERSMKNRTPTSETITTQHNYITPKLAVTVQNPPVRKRKDSKKLSLSETVLQDTRFVYGSNDESFKSSTSNEASKDEKPQQNAQLESEEPSLPSFEELVHFVHPDKLPFAKIDSYASAVTGVRSVCCSPTRIEQWETTPPRRIHSMESLSNLLE